MISVAMSTYNGEKYIKKQLDSIYKQDIRPDEVIIVDDCSQDSTVRIMYKYIENKPEIAWHIYVNERNQGYIKNFFRAIEYCNGDIIILCDQDDIWSKDKVKEIVNVFENPFVISYHSEIDIIDQNDNLIKRGVIGYRKYNVQYSTYNFLHRLNYCGMSSAFRASIKKDLNMIDPDKVPTHDWVIHALASIKGGMFISNKVTTYRRYHMDNVALIMEKPKRKKMEQRLNVVKNYYRYYELYLSLFERFGSGDLRIERIVRKYLLATTNRIEYLEHRQFVCLLKNVRYIRYYSSSKAYICDFLYMIGLF